jgi:hypothetical protein
MVNNDSNLSNVPDNITVAQLSIDWLHQWGQTDVSQPRPPTGLLLILRVNVSVESHGDDVF